MGCSYIPKLGGYGFRIAHDGDLAKLVKSLHVVKVPTADMVEGSLGGTINVKTYRGLGLKKPLPAANRAIPIYKNTGVSIAIDA
mgnify:CR=1 FL=1